MASVIFHAFNQIKKTGKVKLFKSYIKGFGDSEQKRDFIYVKDIVNSIIFFMENFSENEKINGIYNIRIGNARIFNDLAVSVFKMLKLKPNIEYIDMPESLRDKYQYFTEAKIEKFKKIGYVNKFYSLEDGIKDYVCNYLDKNYKRY